MLASIVNLPALLIGLVTLLATTHALTDAERKSALDAHNLRRSQLAGGKSLNKTGLPMPTGKNIWTMSYDLTLEAKVQAWLNQCTFSHNPNGYENLYWIGTQQAPVTALSNAISLWWGELQTNGCPQNLMLPTVGWEKIGHWSAMAWATTTKVGCGVTYCAAYGRTYAGCQYNSTLGNYMGQTIYNAGPVCSGCPVVNGQLKCQYGLCIP
ncbi:venom allergen-like protein vap-2 [Aphelenchoides avenae]|nr:venom allergen-like protein vap-2 [Aphelenchus avenae]